MPKRKRRKSSGAKTVTESKDALDAAAAYYENEGKSHKTSIRAAAEKYNVARSSLWDIVAYKRRSVEAKMSEDGSKTIDAASVKKPFHQQMLLTPSEESQLVQWILGQNEAKAPPSRKEVCIQVAKILQSRNPPEKLRRRPSARWYERFQNRHNLSLRQSRPIETARAKAITKEVCFTMSYVIVNT